MKIECVKVLDVKVSVLTFNKAIETLEGFVDSNNIHYVCVNSAQDIIISQKNERFKRIVNKADLTIPDGMPLVWLSRLAGYKYAERVTGPDLMLAMCERSPITKHSHFFYGGKPDVPDLLIKKLTQRFPGIQIAGGYSPPFRHLTEKEDREIIQMINSSNADFLWVGLGTPKQHYWIADHIDRLNVSVVSGVGAAFDYHSGKMRRAPLWMQRSGLEWLYRFTHYPGPVSRRYAKYLPKFVFYVGLELMGLKNFNNKHKKHH